MARGNWSRLSVVGELDRFAEALEEENAFEALYGLDRTDVMEEVDLFRRGAGIAPRDEALTAFS